MAPSNSFLSTLQDNRRYFLITILVTFIQITLFKFFYPFADYFSDSYSYIYAAAIHADVNIWPIGYSKFLWLFHKVSISDTALVTTQYFLIILSELYLFLTIVHFFPISRLIKNVIWSFLFLNPLLLYLSNYISSDAIFLGLSLIWISQLLWIINRPQWYHVIVTALVVAIAFTIRYNAMYYPIITTLALLISKQRLFVKLSGISLPLLLITLFVLFTKQKTQEITGTNQFSVFSGWQLANNALYMFPHIEIQKNPPTGCEEFHLVVEKYFKEIPIEYKDVSPLEGAFYIKYPQAPLKKYLADRVDQDKDTSGGIQSWGAVAPIYYKYGKYMIIHYPFGYFRYFIVPNSYNYFLPPLEKLEEYNLGSLHVSSIAQQWFGYRHSNVKVASITIQKLILFLFPSIFLLLNVLFSLNVILWLRSNRIAKEEANFKSCIILISFFVIINAAFGILASPIVLRYQVFPMIVLFSFTMLLSNRLDQQNE